MNEKILLKLSILSLVILFILQTVLFSFNDFLLGIMLYFLFLGLILGELVLIVYSIVLIVKKYKNKKIKSTYPLIFCILFFVQLIYAPQSEWISDLSFKMKYDKRMEVVKMYEKHELKTSSEGFDVLVLPKDYKSLSDSGEVVPLGDKLMFFDVRGVIDNFSAYVYSKDGTPPTKSDVNADIIYIEKINKHWFYISCT